MSIQTQYTVANLQELAELFKQRAADALERSIKSATVRGSLQESREAMTWEAAARIVSQTVIKGE